MGQLVPALLSRVLRTSVYVSDCTGVEYNWRWEVSGGEGGTVEGSTEPTLVLSHVRKHLLTALDDLRVA